MHFCSLKGQAGSTMASRKRTGLLMALALAVPFTAFVGLSKLVNVGEIKEPIRKWSACGVRRLSGRKSLTARLAAPYVWGFPLIIGSLVAYELDLPGSPRHAAIYVGPGDEKLRNKTGRSDLDPKLHYVVEYSGPTCPGGILPSSLAGCSKKGKGGQKIWISPMEPSTDWQAFGDPVECLQ